MSQILGELPGETFEDIFERGSLFEPETQEIYVSKDTAREGHQVRKSYEVKRGRNTFYVWECICGSSSALMQTKGTANESYRKHKRGE